MAEHIYMEPVTGNVEGIGEGRSKGPFLPRRRAWPEEGAQRRWRLK